MIGFEFSLDTASLDDLEAVTHSVSRESFRGWFSAFEGTEEAALLTTCHRVEIVLVVPTPEEAARWRDVLPGPPESWRTREDLAAVDHLFRVAAGRESLARGEAEVRHQVRAASGRVMSRHPRPVLRELMDRAADVAEEVAPSGPARPSIAGVAAERLLALVGRARPRVLVIGSGTVGRQVAERLAPDARLTVAYHRIAPDAEFLHATGARAVPMARLADELGRADAVVTAAKFGHRGIRASDVPTDRRLLLVDLGVPRNIDPSVRLLPNVRLLDLEELRATRTPFAPPTAPDDPLEERARRSFDRLSARLREPWIDSLWRAADDVRRSELENARRFLGRLDADQEAAVDRLTQRLVVRLLLPPTERVRALPVGPDGDARRRIALELLRPPRPEP